jgi:hypothetical protein
LPVHLLYSSFSYWYELLFKLLSLPSIITTLTESLSITTSVLFWKEEVDRSPTYDKYLHIS